MFVWLWHSVIEESAVKVTEATEILLIERREIVRRNNKNSVASVSLTADSSVTECHNCTEMTWIQRSNNKLSFETHNAQIGPVVSELWAVKEIGYFIRTYCSVTNFPRALYESYTNKLTYYYARNRVRTGPGTKLVKRLQSRLQESPTKLLVSKRTKIWKYFVLWIFYVVQLTFQLDQNMVKHSLHIR